MGSTPNRNALGLIVCATLVAPASFAQSDAQNTSASTLAVDDLVAWVLQENAGLAAARASADAATYLVEPAGSLDDPMLSIGVAPRSSDSNIDISQRLPWPGTLDAREKAARSEARAASSIVSVEQLALVAAAKTAFAEWYFVARGLEIHRQSLALVDQLIATTQARYAAGRALRQDVLQAHIERAELEARVLALLRQRAATLARLNALLNRSPDAPLPRAAAISARLPALEAESLEHVALTRHPELARLEAEIAAAQNRVTLARKAFYPDFQVRAGYNALWEDSDKRPVLGVAINLPIDRSKRRAALDRSEALRRRAEAILAQDRADLASEVRRSHAELIETVAAIEIHETRLVPLATQYLEAALADYRSGAGPFINVISAEQRALATQLTLERTRADYIRRIAELERVTGGPVDTRPTTQPGE